MKRIALWVAALVICNLALTTWAQSRVYILNGVAYRFPTTQGAASTSLSSTDGAGTLGWVSMAGSSEWPSNLVVFSPTGSCPTGWTEYTDARGRYIVGLVSGGTNLATVGTALSNAEDRAVGLHTHTVTDPGHTHVQDAHSHSVSEPGHSHAASLGSTSLSLDASGSDAILVTSGSTATSAASTGVSVNAATATNASATTGVSLANAGSVGGTNAPNIQLKACRTP